MEFEIEMSRLVRDAEAKIAAKIAAQQMGECFDDDTSERNADHHRDPQGR
jgi:hypothetical protein